MAHGNNIIRKKCPFLKKKIVSLKAKENQIDNKKNAEQKRYWIQMSAKTILGH